jgi:protein-arginine kinase activator protein McsA
MKLPKKLLRPKLSEQELIEILENLEKRKARAIKNQQYETAASVRDEERKYREILEDLMNPTTKEENDHPEDQS